MERWIIYKKTTPFAGYIVNAGRFDRNGTVPDDESAPLYKVDAAILQDPDADVLYLPDGIVPDPETQKVENGQIVPRTIQDITLSDTKKNELSVLFARMKQIIENTDFSDVESIIDNNFGNLSAMQRAILKFMAVCCLHYGKSQV